MVLTRPQAQQAFNHVLDNVLGKDDTSPLKRSLAHEGITDIFGLLALDDTTIQGLTYDRSDPETNVAVI